MLDSAYLGISSLCTAIHSESVLDHRDSANCTCNCIDAAPNRNLRMCDEEPCVSYTWDGGASEVSTLGFCRVVG